MSLHLIESRGAVRSTARNPGGTAMSVVLHVAFASAILMLATNSPSMRPPKPVDDRAIYIDPVDPPPPQTSVAAPNSRPNPLAIPTIVPSTIPIVDIAVAPVDVPSLGTAITADYSAAVSHAGTSGSGSSNRNVETNAIMNDLQVDKPVIALPGARSPKYPDVLRAAGIEDSVIATFVVDTMGRVEPTSFEVKNAPRAQFVLSVRDALMATKFKPAEAQGHLVRQRVIQAFVFSLKR